MVTQEFNDNDNDIEFEIENLMSSFEPAPKVMILNNATGTNLLGMVEEENEDSFLVFAPCRMIKNDAGQVSVVPFVPVDYVRLMKSQVLMVMPMEDPFLDPFLNYLDEKPVSDIIVNVFKSGGDETQDEVSDSHHDLVEKLEEAAEQGRLYYDGSNTKH